MDPQQTIDSDLWFDEAERKLVETIRRALVRGDWQAVWEDATIGKAVFGGRRGSV